MNLNTIDESDIEQTALDWLSDLGYTVLHGPDIAPDTADAERSRYEDVVLPQRLRDAIARLNPNLPAESQEEAVQRILSPNSPALVQNNRTIHRMLVDGVEVEYRDSDGATRGGGAQLVDFENFENNDWLAVNQFTVVGDSERRPDIVLFINGIPVGVIELKTRATRMPLSGPRFANFRPTSGKFRAFSRITRRLLSLTGWKLALAL